MKADLGRALIIALGLIIGGYLAGGRYEIVHVGSNELARLDRFTGEVSMCINGASCGYVLDAGEGKP